MCRGMRRRRKGTILGGGGGLGGRKGCPGGGVGAAWLYLFIGFHINPLEHGAVCAPFPGMCECFAAIKRKTAFSMDSM